MPETKHILADRPGRGRIGKQIRLPLSKAIEISIKSLRVRFWRSMLTVSSIILAIAFLTYVWTTSRLESAIAIGLRTDAPRVLVVSKAVDDAWKPFERELSKRFSRRRAEYRDEIEALYSGDAAGFRRYCAKAAEDRNKPVSFEGLPFDNAAISGLAARAREIGLEPDLAGWTAPGLALAGVKGVVQRETDRIGNIQLALQRADFDPEAPAEALGHMRPAAVWLILISLLGCGVGITNAMLMSVTERFREIGTMKCLGALDTFIVKLFLLESTMQGLAGTAIGIVLGLAVMLAMSLASFGSAAMAHFPALDAALIVLWAVLIGAGLSIAGAIFPALRAARMAHVEAMRADE